MTPASRWAAAAGPSSDTSAKAVFFEALPDIPVMPGFQDMTQSILVFDKPGGQVVEASAWSTHVSADEVIGYYDQALSPLGWVRSGTGVYGRGGDVLRLEITKMAAGTILKVTVMPR